MPDPKTAIFLPQSVIAGLREALSVSDTREDELRSEVSRWEEALELATVAVQVIKNVDEHDARFFHPSFNRHTPFSRGIKERQVLDAQGDVEEATGRLAFARAALRNYLETLPNG